MNILRIVNLNPKKYGGFERYCTGYTAYLNERGHNNYLFFLKEPIASVRSDLINSGARIYVHDFKKLGFTESRVLLNFIKEKDIDIVHMHFYPSIYSIFSLFVAFSGAKYFVSYHMSGEPTRNSIFKRFAKRVRSLVLGHGIDKVFCVSSFNQKKFVVDYQESINKTQVTYNGIDISGLQKKKQVSLGSNNRFIIICAANLIREKGLQYLIKALPVIIDHNLDIEVMIIGEGKYHKELNDLAVELEVDNYVNFMGLRNDVISLMAEADLSVIPSIWAEAFGYTVLESMAVGLPVIASKVGGIPELIEDEVNGLLVKPGDAEALASAVIRLMSDRDLRVQMSNENIQRAQNKFGLHRLFNEQYENYIRG